MHEPHRLRIDYEVIESLIEPNSSVLDIGCGDGQLLDNLIRDKNIKGEGIELDEKLVLNCVARGLPIAQMIPDSRKYMFRRFPHLSSDGQLL